MNPLSEIKKTIFNIKQGYSSEGFLADEVQTLNQLTKKIAQRLNYNGRIKVIHQDQLGAVACHVNQECSGYGVSLEGIAVNHSQILKNL